MSTSQESPATCVCLSFSLFFHPHRSATHEDELPTCDVSFIRSDVQIACFLLFLHSSDPSFSSITHRVHVFQQLNLRPSPMSPPVDRSPGLVLGPLCISCFHQALEGAAGHFSALSKNCTLLSTESHCTHDPLSPALWLLF